ncbi:sodium:alanine symporter family protein [Shewanella benthica KT99]|uniref:Sodium:alanine symporter family protein n=1 Tax=Shewanella benthica KT99 TaxID=314608 RepID=A9CUU7_9GAMM|nr:sodium:alanine symporter family protein [Shewanella benthica KT99]
MAVAFFGIGTFAQVNAISDAMTIAFDVPTWVTALVLTLLVAAVTLGGVTRIANVAKSLVPSMALAYIIACLGILFSFSDQILPTFDLVITSAFTPISAAGGFLGATVAQALQIGITSWATEDLDSIRGYFYC